MKLSLVRDNWQSTEPLLPPLLDIAAIHLTFNRTVSQPPLNFRLKLFRGRGCGGNRHSQYVQQLYPVHELKRDERDNCEGQQTLERYTTLGR